jgi:hypothetical protein
VGGLVVLSLAGNQAYHDEKFRTIREDAACQLACARLANVVMLVMDPGEWNNNAKGRRDRRGDVIDS